MKRFIFSAILLVIGSELLALTPKEPVKFAVGIHTGFDIGAAVPWPPGEVIGGGNKMSAVPHLNPALGLSYTTVFNQNWALVLESTYKTVAIDAKTRGIQKFTSIENGAVVKQIFDGTAEAKMSYTMFEIPLYLKYTFNNGTNRVFLGGYYAHIINGQFEATPQKGMLGEPGSIPAPVSPESAITQNFDDAMDNWDAGFILGYERRLIKRVTLSGRFSMGFKDVFKNDKKYLEYSMLHMRGTVVLSYMFLRK